MNEAVDWIEKMGVVYSTLKTNFNASGEVAAVIFPPNRSDPKFVLSINGYLFKHDTLEQAKADAVDRVANNVGIYLSYLLP